MIQRRAIDLLCLAMGMTLAAHMGHLPWWLTAALAAILASRWWLLRRGAKRVPAWLKLPLVALLVATVVMYWGSIFGRAPGSALAIGLLILKLLETTRERDVRSGVAFGCFVLMSALLFDRGMSFTAFVLLALVPNLAALQAIQPRGTPPRWRAEWQPVLRSLLWALPLALFAFLFIPRLATPLWGAPDYDEALPGLASSMTPSNLSDLLIDDTPAMRVSFEGTRPPPAQRYFRGWVMSRFDGHTWSHSRFWRRPIEQLEVTDTRSYSYSIQLEPASGHVLPTLDVAISAGPDARLGPLRTAFAHKPLGLGRRYHGRSAVRYQLQPRLDARTRKINLQLPTDIDPQARQLARRWQQRYGSDHAAIARAALDMYHNQGFSYTLAPAPLGYNSIDDFLFSTREGFCQQYASSFTFLMRAAGVPARVVTGYQGGYWNKLSDYLLVRNSNAHAWSEIWLAGRGWVRFDPTAAVRPDRVNMAGATGAGTGSPWYQTRWIEALRNQWDTVNHWWNKTIVAFDSVRQKGMLTRFGIEHTDLGDLTLALAIGCSLLLAIAALLVLRQPRRRDPLLAIQLRLEKKLARLGVTRRPNEGPHDFMQRAMRALPGHARRLQRMYHRYMHLRYARRQPTAREIAAYRRLVRESMRRHVVQ